MDPVFTLSVNQPQQRGTFSHTCPPSDQDKARRARERSWKRDTLLLKLGAARKEAGRAWNFVKLTLPKAGEEVNPDTFSFQLLKDKLKAAELSDGHYLLRGFRAGDQGGTLWEIYMQLTEVEAVFTRKRQYCRRYVNDMISAAQVFTWMGTICSLPASHVGSATHLVGAAGRQPVSPLLHPDQTPC